MKLQPECSAFVGNTLIHGQTMVEAFENITHNSHPNIITFDDCNHLHEQIHIPKVESIKVSKINTDDFNIVEHKLNQHSDQLDKMIN